MDGVYVAPSELNAADDTIASGILALSILLGKRKKYGENFVGLKKKSNFARWKLYLGRIALVSSK